jgi:hypothetical protein
MHCAYNGSDRVHGVESRDGSPHPNHEHGHDLHNCSTNRENTVGFEHRRLPWPVEKRTVAERVGEWEEGEGGEQDGARLAVSVSGREGWKGAGRAVRTGAARQRVEVGATGGAW